MKKKINIIVGGFFYAHRLCRTLKKNDWEITLFTTMPKSRFPDLLSNEIYSFFWIEILSRIASKLGFENKGNEWKMKAFERAILRTGAISPENTLIAWSGFATEVFKTHPSNLKILIRDSTHIETQIEILEKEYSKRNLKLSNHSETIYREKEEYRLADFILIPSEFSKESFLKKGIEEKKLHKILLGNNLEISTSPNFPTHSQDPLNILFFGNITLQKGIMYLWEALQPYLKAQKVNFSCFGFLSSEITQLIPEIQKFYKGFVQHREMKEKFSEFDIFVFPTLQDGFGFTLLESMSLGILPIVSKNCGASEIITHQVNGLLIDPFSSEQISDQVQWCLDNRGKIAAIKRKAFETACTHSWTKHEQNLSKWLSSLEETKFGTRKVS